MCKTVSVMQKTHTPCSRFLSKQVLQDENRIGGTLRQSPHQVGIPLRAKGNVDAAVPAVLDQLQLQVATDAVQHLELKRCCRNVCFPREPNRCLDHLLIVRSDPVVCAAQEQHPH